MELGHLDGGPGKLCGSQRGEEGFGCACISCLPTTVLRQSGDQTRNLCQTEESQLKLAGYRPKQMDLMQGQTAGTQSKVASMGSSHIMKSF